VRESVCVRESETESERESERERERERERETHLRSHDFMCHPSQNFIILQHTQNFKLK